VTTINLHIERLVLDGLPLGVRDGPLVRAAVAAELARLLADEPPPGALATGRNAPLVRAGTIARPAADGTGLGTQIGAAVFAGLAG